MVIQFFSNFTINLCYITITRQSDSQLSYKMQKLSSLRFYTKSIRRSPLLFQALARRTFTTQNAPKIFEVDESNFTSQVLQSKTPVLLDCYATFVFGNCTIYH